MSDIPSYQPKRPARRRSLEIRLAQYNVTEWGDPNSPLLVYLHGWADAGSTFQFVVDALERNWHIVAPDWRGFGRSSVRCTSYWFPDYVADLHALLDVYSPEQPVRIVGHSMGGNVAGLYAGTMPERVRSFVNIEGFGLTDSDPVDAPKRYRRWLEEAHASPAFSTYADMEALAMRIAKRHPQMSASQADFVAREWGVERDDGRVALRADPQHKLPNPVLYRRAEAEACWRAITAEVLMVCGASSDFSQQFLQIDNASFPGDHQVEIEGAGHMVHFERPAALARVLEEFLSNHL